jgi:hypothetical protein
MEIFEILILGNSYKKSHSFKNYFRHRGVSLFSNLYWTLKSFFSEYKRIKSLFKTDNKNEKSISKADFLLYGMSLNRSFNYQGEFYNKTLNSIKPLLDKKGKSLFIESTVNNQISVPKYSYSHLIDHRVNYEFLKRKIRYIISKKKSRISGYYELKKFLEKNNLLHIIPDEFYLIELTEEIIAFRSCFDMLIDKISPKVIFLDEFYHKGALGAILSSKEKGVVCVDLQHGLAGRYTPMYGQWEKKHLKKTGVFLPDIFWVWDQKHYHELQEWCSLSNRNQVVLAGNPFIGQLKKLYNNIDHDSFEKTRILISLQALEETEVNYIINILIPCILDSHNIEWVIRYHPVFIEEQRKWINKILKDNAGVQEKVVLEDSLLVSIYDSLSKTQIHVSGHSTVCMESLMFGVKSVILGQNGYDHYIQYIKEGVFNYASNKDDFMRVINEQICNIDQISFALLDEQIDEALNALIEDYT